jgi:hypothetical protein
MEDRDAIGGDEVNRIEELETIIRRSKWVVSGDGNILGGFGKLPPTKGLSLKERLANIKNAADSYSLTGENVDPAGNFDDGFILS